MYIRPVELADRALWQVHMLDYAGFYKTEMTPDGLETIWQWIFDPNNDFWCDLAFADDHTPIGFAQYQLMHRTLSGGMVCYLSDLYVRPDVRGSGAGRAMIDHVIAFARARGLNNVRWLTHESNSSARRLYDTYVKTSGAILYSLPV